MNQPLLYLNALAAAGSLGAAVVELARPGALLGRGRASADGRFYGRLYAARALPSAVLIGALPFTSPGPAAAAVLLVAAVSQAADAALGLQQRKRAMTISPAIATVVHLATAAMLSGR